MKKIFRLFWMSAAASLIIMATVNCGKNDDGDGNIFTVESVDLTGIPSAGVFKTLKITANITWEITGTTDWCSVEPSSGTGDSNVTVTIKENESTDQRTATLTAIASGFNPVSISVAQSGGDVLDRIKDADFRAWIASKYLDGADRLTESKAAAVETMSIPSDVAAKMSTIEGLENFTGLKTFQCAGASAENIINVKGIDFSPLKKLESIAFYYNSGVTSIRISDMPELAALNASWNPNLASVEIKNCPKLTGLHLNNCGIKELDIDGTGQLSGSSSVLGTSYETISIKNTGLKNLAIGSCAKLTSAVFDNIAGLETLHLCECPLLTTLTAIDVGTVTDMNISRNPLLTAAGLKLGNMPSMKSFYCNETALGPELDICIFSEALTSFNCLGTGINTLKVWWNPADGLPSQLTGYFSYPAGCMLVQKAAVDPGDPSDPYYQTSVTVTPSNKAAGISASVLDNMLGKKVYLVTDDFYGTSGVNKMIAARAWFCGAHMGKNLSYFLQGFGLAGICAASENPAELTIAKALGSNSEWLKNSQGAGLYNIGLTMAGSNSAFDGSSSLVYFPKYAPYPVCLYNENASMPLSELQTLGYEDTFTITAEEGDFVNIAAKSGTGAYDLFLLNANKAQSMCSSSLTGGSCSHTNTLPLTMALEKGAKSANRTWSIVPAETLRLKEIFFDFDADMGDGASVKRVEGAKYVTDNNTGDNIVKTVTLEQRVETTSSFEDVAGMSSHWDVSATVSVSAPVVSASITAEYGQSETSEFRQGESTTTSTTYTTSDQVIIRPNSRLSAQLYYNQYDVVLTYVMVFEGADSKQKYYVRGKWSNVTQSEVRTIYNIEAL